MYRRRILYDHRKIWCAPQCNAALVDRGVETHDNYAASIAMCSVKEA